MESRHDARECRTTTSSSPEEVLVGVRIRPNELAVSRHRIDGNYALTRPAPVLDLDQLTIFVV